MIINGKDVSAFYKSHSLQQINTVIQTLEAFGLNRELELYLKNGKYKKRYKPEPIDLLDKRLGFLNYPCPRCNARLLGTGLVRCAGRTWYEECTKCNYYREEFGGK
jgi:hypothetical protein